MVATSAKLQFRWVHVWLKDVCQSNSETVVKCVRSNRARRAKKGI